MRITTVALVGLSLSVAAVGCTAEVSGESGVAGQGLGSDESGGSGSDSVGSIDSRVCASGSTVKGVDVSYYQGTINWTKVKAAGIDFAFVRVSDGDVFKDPTFAANWSGTKAAGVIRGAYQFFRPTQSISEQANLMIAAIGTYTPGDLPPVLDVEVTSGLSATKLAANVASWVKLVHDALGVTPIVYTGMYFWRDQVGGSTAELTSPLWVAEYTSACPNIPSPWTRWTFWQNNDQSSVIGIPGGGVDVDKFNGTLADLQAFAQGTPTTTPVTALAYNVSRDDSGVFTFAAVADASVASVEIRVDDYLISVASPSAGQITIPYTFNVHSTGRVVEVRGLSSAGATVTVGNGVLDSTDAPGVYAHQTGDHEYEIGLEVMTDDVAAVNVTADGIQLTDEDSGEDDSTRGAVRWAFSEVGERALTITTLDADGNVIDSQDRTLLVR